MPERHEITYFGAGPAALPTSVLTRAAQSLVNHAQTGYGLAEHSHRSALANDILRSCTENLKRLLHVPDNYTVVYSQGGGTGGFSAAVYNLVGAWVARTWEEEGGDVEKVKARLAETKAEYLVTGAWSKKARKEAQRLLGPEAVHSVTDSEKENGKWGDIAGEDKWTFAKESFLTYYCDNETVDGVEFPGVPAVPEGRFLVADCSSNILSRAMDVNKFAVIFGGAQKNVGITGLTLYIIRNDILEKNATDAQLRALGLPLPPVIMSWPEIAKQNSLYNTLPIFDVWVAGEVIRELNEKGGIAVQEGVANQKADLLYGVLEKYPQLYAIVPAKRVRSRMNICFRIKKDGAEDKELEAAFIKGAEAQGLLGLKGHRSVGGIRISNYNSIPVEGAEKLAKWLEEFAQGK